MASFTVGLGALLLAGNNKFLLWRVPRRKKRARSWGTLWFFAFRTPEVSVYWSCCRRCVTELRNIPLAVSINPTYIFKYNKVRLPYSDKAQVLFEEPIGFVMDGAGTSIGIREPLGRVGHRKPR